MAAKRTAPPVQRPREATPGAPPRERHEHEASGIALALLRVGLGWIFLWAFLDKLFGLGHSTPPDAAWIGGASPTEGFLAHAPSGPMSGLYHAMAGAVWADVLFMAGMLGLGAALVLGIGLRVAAVAGAALMLMLWAAVLPPENNPLIDKHIIYAVGLAVVALHDAGATLGLGRRWRASALVRRAPILR